MFFDDVCDCYLQPFNATGESQITDKFRLILGNNQLDTLFRVLIYFMSVHVSSITVLIIRRSNRINTSSGMISLRK